MYLREWAVHTQAKLVSCLALVALADILFYHRLGAGSVTGLFLLLLCGTVALANPAGMRAAGGLWMLWLAVGQAVAAGISPNWIGITLCMLLLAGYGLHLGARCRDAGALDAMRALMRYLLRGWFRFIRDLIQAYRTAVSRPRKRGASLLLMVAWAVPLVIAGVFVWLFTQANPVLELWVSTVVHDWFNAPFSWARIGFWLAMASGLWALLRPRMKRRQRPAPSHRDAWVEHVFAPRLLLFSLLLFNGIFLVQNAMDAAYLWHGTALPMRMGYAHYAQRGAYPLIATSLLAALFVLFTLRPESAHERSRAIRALVYIWIGQNIFLVFSSMLRLVNYIDAYSLTGWRVAALCWMGLVACGLTLIVLRIYCARNNEWLVRCNLLCAFVVLYTAPFFNIDRMIAEYNVRHCAIELPYPACLDRYYLYGLGSESIPALRWYAAQFPDQVNNAAMADMEQRLSSQLSDWRRWTVRAYLLSLALSEKD